jgi:hypothetical protein
MNKYVPAFPNYRVKNDYPIINKIGYQIDNIEGIKTLLDKLECKMEILSHPRIKIILNNQIILKGLNLNKYKKYPNNGHQIGANKIRGKDRVQRTAFGILSK